MRKNFHMKKYLDTTLTPQERAEALADEMTVEEMAGQLRFDAPAIDRLGIPAYNWWNEGLHGLARSGTTTMFPQAIALAAMFDTELVRKAGEITSLETRAKYSTYSKHGDRDIYKGLTLWAPNINIFRDPRWGRGHETYGEDPYLTAENGKAYVKGLQGEEKLSVQPPAQSILQSTAAPKLSATSLMHRCPKRSLKKHIFPHLKPL